MIIAFIRQVNYYGVDSIRHVNYCDITLIKQMKLLCNSVYKTGQFQTNSVLKDHHHCSVTRSLSASLDTNPLFLLFNYFQWWYCLEGSVRHSGLSVSIISTWSLPRRKFVNWLVLPTVGKSWKGKSRTEHRVFDTQGIPSGKFTTEHRVFETQGNASNCSAFVTHATRITDV